jgi:hypothetical protein
MAGLKLIGSWDYDKRDNRTQVRAWPSSRPTCS